MLILHVFLTAANHESRFLKEAASTVRHLGHEVLLAARWKPGMEEHTAVQAGVSIWRVRITTASLPKSLPFQLVKGVEWRSRILHRGRQLRPGIIHCHSLLSLPVGAQLKRATGAKLLYDCHELETERAGLRGVRRLMEKRMERRLIGTCDAVLVVSDSIADWYGERYGIARPTVVRNVPDVRTQRAFTGSRLLRERIGLADDSFLFLYQGGMLRSRRIDQFVRVFAQAKPDRHIVFMGNGEMEDHVRMAAARHSNIHHLPAVAPQDVLSYTASADIGLVGMENDCLNHFFALPNKLFEYLLAGIPVLAGDWPEIKAVLTSYACGWTWDEGDEALLRLINDMTREDIEARRPGIARAQQAFSWENEEGQLLDVYRNLTRDGHERDRVSTTPGSTTGG